MVGDDGTRWVTLILDPDRVPLCGWTQAGRFVVWGPVQSIASQLFDVWRQVPSPGASHAVRVGGGQHGG